MVICPDKSELRRVGVSQVCRLGQINLAAPPNLLRNIVVIDK